MNAPQAPVANDTIVWRRAHLEPSSMILGEGSGLPLLLHACKDGPELPQRVERECLDPMALGVCIHCGLRLP